MTSVTCRGSGLFLSRKSRRDRPTSRSSGCPSWACRSLRLASSRAARRLRRRSTPTLRSSHLRSCRSRSACRVRTKGSPRSLNLRVPPGSRPRERPRQRKRARLPGRPVRQERRRRQGWMPGQTPPLVQVRPRPVTRKGPGDRAAVRDHVFDALRRRRSLAALGGAETGRGLMLGALRAAGTDPAGVFTGAGHAPAPLTAPEAAHLARPRR
jgi:hypothetical protein